MNDIPGKFLGIILVAALCIMMPFVNVTINEEIDARHLIIEDMSDYIDSITDGRVNSDADQKAFEAKLASYGMVLDYEVTRQARTVNPDPFSQDDYYVSYVEMDDTTHFEKGDKVTVHVWQVSGTTTGNIARRIAGIFSRDLDFTITARVR